MIEHKLCFSYTEYKFLYNETYAKYAKLGTRNEARFGKEGFMMDVYMLAKCDFVVCTLTSNVSNLYLLWCFTQ